MKTKPSLLAGYPTSDHKKARIFLRISHIYCIPTQRVLLRF